MSLKSLNRKEVKRSQRSVSSGLIRSHLVSEDSSGWTATQLQEREVQMLGSTGISTAVEKRIHKISQDSHCIPGSNPIHSIKDHTQVFPNVWNMVFHSRYSRFLSKTFWNIGDPSFEEQCPVSRCRGVLLKTRFEKRHTDGFNLDILRIGSSPPWLSWQNPCFWLRSWWLVQALHVSGKTPGFVPTRATICWLKSQQWESPHRRTLRQMLHRWPNDWPRRPCRSVCPQKNGYVMRCYEFMRCDWKTWKTWDITARSRWSKLGFGTIWVPGPTAGIDSSRRGAAPRPHRRISRIFHGWSLKRMVKGRSMQKS